MKGKIFNAQEVQAIIAGNKTMFREVIKPQPPLGCHYTINGNQSHALCFADCSTPRDERDYSKEPLVCVPPKPTNIDHRLECPYKVGEEIFVKESFAVSKTLFQDIKYLADNQKKWGFISNDLAVWKKRPAQYMKQEHSRLTLEITNIKVERLAEISKEDAIKEGATSRPNCHGYANRYEGWCMNWNKVGETSKWASNRKTLSESDVCMGSAQYAFINSWIATHKKPEEKFEANPFVWVVDFKINN